MFNRTLIYGVLITMIGAVYVFGVVQTDSLLGLPGGWASAPQIVAAGLIALAFQPVRAWLGDGRTAWSTAAANLPTTCSPRYPR